MNKQEFQLLFQEIQKYISDKFPILTDKIDYEYYDDSDEYFILIYDENTYFNNIDFQKSVLDIKMNILWKRGIYNVFISYEEKISNNYEFLIRIPYQNEPRKIIINNISVHIDKIDKTELLNFYLINEKREINYISLIELNYTAFNEVA